MDRKTRERRAALRKSIAANPERQKMYGDAWDAIAKAHQALPSYIRERRIFDQAGGFNTVLFDFARTLVRLAEENAKAERASVCPNSPTRDGLRSSWGCIRRRRFMTTSKS